MTRYLTDWIRERERLSEDRLAAELVAVLTGGKDCRPARIEREGAEAGSSPDPADRSQ